MKKLKLNLDDLKVESFEISTANQPIKGTVKGLACSGDDTDPTSFCQCPSAGCGVTGASCPGTCGNIQTCAGQYTCLGTCPGVNNTCNQSCDGTCYNTCGPQTCDVSPTCNETACAPCDPQF